MFACKFVGLVLLLLRPRSCLVWGFFSPKNYDKITGSSPNEKECVRWCLCSQVMFSFGVCGELADYDVQKKASHLKLGIVVGAEDQARSLCFDGKLAM